MPQIYSGNLFNKIFSGPFVLINQDYSDKKYELGLNIDPNSINYDMLDGIFFVDFRRAFYYHSPKSYMYQIQIPDDALVYFETYRYRTSKIILLDKYKFEDHPLWSNYELCKKIIQFDSWSIKFMKNQDYELSLLAVKNRGDVLKYIINKTYDICLAAVNENPLALEFVDNKFKSIELLKLAVSKNGLALEFIEENLQNNSIVLIALKQNLQAYKLIKIKNQQSDKICDLIENFLKYWTFDNYIQLQLLTGFDVLSF